MARPSKRTREIANSLDVQKTYSVKEAIDKLKQCRGVKFDQTLDMALKLGVDPRIADQNVRGTVALPNGTGKKVRILVFTKDKIKEALAAGAAYAGYEELIEKVNGGWTDFDVVISTPDMMREVGKLGKVLGPRGLMPTPKAGTVTVNVAEAVKELLAGRIEFRVDRHGVINVGLGKLSFDADRLVENVTAFLYAVSRAKPASSKGVYMLSAFLSSTMGPGLKIDMKTSELTGTS